MYIRVLLYRCTSLYIGITTNSGAKTVRLDILVKDDIGTSYDIEMQVGNEYNIPKRMRYYQAVLDVAFLDKGYSYKALNNSVIIFVCLFDPIGNDRAIYTFENICIEDKTIPLHDGTKKIILNAKAFKETDNQELRGFLQYVTTGKATTAYTGRVEQMIQNRAIDYPNYSPPRKIPAITKIRHTGTKTYCI